MSNFILELGTGIKKLLRERMNIVIILLIINIGFNLYDHYLIRTDLTNNTVSIKKKIDHRYFNTTTTLKQLHNIEVNTYNGELKPKFSY